MNPSFLIRFGSLRLALALLELPLFVLLPKFYGSLGLALSTVGLTLFLIRLADAVLDPLIGQALDQSKKPYRFWILLILPVLILAFYLNFHPMIGLPAGKPTDASGFAPSGLTWWLGLSSALTYLCYSVLSIAYQSWGARLGQNAHEKTQVTVWREGLGLLGVVLAASFMTPDKIDALTALFVVFCALAAWALHSLMAGQDSSEPDAKTAPSAPPREQASGPWQAWSLLLEHPAFARLMSVFVINGIASAIPATLLLFFVEDVLKLSHRVDVFLLGYFAAGALGMPFWLWASQRVGLRRAWLLGMLVAMVAFVSASRLEAGAFFPFLMICVATGLALGADLALPSAILALLIQQRGEKGSARQASYFGLWNLATKANLAIAAGLGLPILTWLGYRPQLAADVQTTVSTHVNSPEALWALSFAYAGLPCVLKLMAIGTLARSPFDPHVQVKANPIVFKEK